MPPTMRAVSRPCFSSPPPSLLSPFHAATPAAVAVFSTFPRQVGGCSTSGNGVWNRGRGRTKRLGASERDSEYEIDRDKALAALEQLDQQLKSLSEKETAPTRKRPPPPPPSSPYSDPDLLRREMMGMGAEEGSEMSGSVLAYAAVALLLLTIVNNILFGVFIKPYVDGDYLYLDTESQPPGGSKEQLLSLPSETP